MTRRPIETTLAEPLQDLQRIAEELAPCSTLLLAPEHHPLAGPLAGLLAEGGDFRHLDATVPPGLPTDLPRQRLALVADTLERLNAAEGEALLALLRDRLAETLYCLVEPERWPPARMLALGLRPLGAYPRDGGVALYHFDLYDYKRTPDWLNPRHWANPEQWDRHRW